MFGRLFTPYGKAWTFLNTITDAVFLSLLWLVCSLPLITLGASTAALYDSAVRSLRCRQDGVYRRFFRTFRETFPALALSTLLWGLILGFGFYMLAVMDALAPDNRSMAIAAGGYRVLMWLPLGVYCWSCAIASRFQMKFRDITAAAFRLTLSRLPSTLLIAAAAWFTGLLCKNYTAPIAFLPAVCMVVWSLPAERVFREFQGEIDVQTEDAES